jgi:shikimate dehydrogenase
VLSATGRLGVVGWPVAHSRSPAMQNAALGALGLHGWRYQRLPVPPELFAETMRALAAAGFHGVNVTVPHKHAALEIADAATEAARAIGAANTLTFATGAIHADNTDAPGLIASLPSPVAGATALVLGAGGSARAVAWALRHAGAARVAVFNRTTERARTLAEDLGVEVAAEIEPADVLVNCTTIGLHDHDAAPLDLAAAVRDYGTIVDLVYREGGTALTRAAMAAGIPSVDGLEILVAQGALSLARWTGREAPRDVMRAAAATPA